MLQQECKNYIKMKMLFRLQGKRGWLKMADNKNATHTSKTNQGWPK
jgi:hypothetical protein